MIPTLFVKPETRWKKFLRFLTSSVKGSNDAGTTWPQILRSIHLTCSGEELLHLDSNRITSIVTMLMSLINALRLAAVTFSPNSYKLALYCGGLMHGFGNVGRTLHLTALFCCLQVCILRCIFLWKDCPGRTILQEIHKRQRILITNPLAVVSLAASMRLSNSAVRWTNKLAIIAIFVAEAITVYGTAKLVQRELDWYKRALWIFWLFVNMLVIKTVVRDMIWIFGWWLSMVAKLLHEADDLIEVVATETSIIDNMAEGVEVISPAVDLKRTLKQICRCYSDLIIRTENFNKVSKHIIFYMSVCTTIINASMMYSYLRVEDSLIAPGFLLFWFIFSFLSLLTMATTTFLYQSNCKLYRQLNSFFVRSGKFMQTPDKFLLQGLIRSTGCQSRSLVSLSMIDGDFFQKRAVIRYVFYCTRIYAFMINYADQWA